MEKNLTSGSVLKSILFFSLPYLLSYFLQTLYGMADLFIIGQFEGVASTTAVSIGSQVMHMITVMIVGLAMGATVTIGRAVGAENKPRAARLIGNTVTLFMAGSVVVVRECPVRYNGATNRTAGSQGGQNDVRTEQDRFWQFSGTAAQGKGHDPEGACRLPVCFG